MVDKKRVWSVKDSEDEFIELWRARPCLFATSSSEYFDRAKWARCIKELAAHFNNVEQNIKTKITSVRTQYSKVLDELPTGLGGVRRTERQLFLLNACSFLKRYITRLKGRTSSLHGSQSQNANESAQESQQEDSQEDDAQEVSSDMELEEGPRSSGCNLRQSSEQPSTSHALAPKVVPHPSCSKPQKQDANPPQRSPRKSPRLQKTGTLQVDPEVTVVPESPLTTFVSAPKTQRKGWRSKKDKNKAPTSGRATRSGGPQIEKTVTQNPGPTECSAILQQPVVPDSPGTHVTDGDIAGDLDNFGDLPESAPTSPGNGHGKGKGKGKSSSKKRKSTVTVSHTLMEDNPVNPPILPMKARKRLPNVDEQDQEIFVSIQNALAKITEPEVEKHMTDNEVFCGDLCRKLDTITDTRQVTMVRERVNRIVFDAQMLQQDIAEGITTRKAANATMLNQIGGHATVPHMQNQQFRAAGNWQNYQNPQYQGQDSDPNIGSYMRML